MRKTDFWPFVMVGVWLGCPGSSTPGLNPVDVMGVDELPGADWVDGGQRPDVPTDGGMDRAPVPEDRLDVVTPLDVVRDPIPDPPPVFDPGQDPRVDVADPSDEAVSVEDVFAGEPDVPPRPPMPCGPCEDDGDCEGVGRCVDLGYSIPVCAEGCGPAMQCPAGFLCEDVPAASGEMTRQCVPADRCPCGPGLAGVTIACASSNAHGTCPGVERCDGDQWLACDAAVPAEEACNGADDDCDGQTDEDFQYSDWDGTKKKKGATCGTGLCAAGTVVCKADLSGVTCSTTGLAKVETCNGVDENCNGQTDEGTDSQCSDGKTCTDDQCQGGQCKHNLITGNCLIAGTCYTEGTLNPANDCQACLTAKSQTAWSNRPAGSSCNDNVFCNGTDTCNGSGSCANHSGNPCPGQDQGPLCNDSCNEDADNCSGQDKSGTSCDDGVFCNGTDTCDASGSCANHAGNPCTGHNTGPNCNDSCNEAAKNCTGSDVTGTSCYDGNAWTKNDQCNGAGSCQGTPYSCDDNAPCTVDTCLGDGGCTYTVADNYCEIPQGSKNCVPANVTNPDNACLACLPAQSQTAWSPLPPTTECDDQDACTIGDHCDNGTCTSGTPLVCEAWNPTCSDGKCYCDVGPPAVQCDGATADTCAAGECRCGSNQACDPTSKNPTCVSGTCQCGTTVCDVRSDRCTDGQCKCGTAALCSTNKVCCNGTCCGAGEVCCPDGTCKPAC